jgi:UDP-N-acetylmuramoylalanine--D-glutamate ligase
MNAANFKGKRVLVMGLGKFGGGAATARWFARWGASVTVTDLRSRRELAPSIRALGPAARKMKFVLGKHRADDFKHNDLIAVNPAVPRESPYLAAARKAGKRIVNDARIFFDTVPNPIAAVTGTRGKTTTTNWIAHFLKANHRGVAPAGNTPEMPLLSLTEKLKNGTVPAAVELSSWQLELAGEARRAPDVAVITNLYPDHLNRHHRMQDYAHAKANIFARQRTYQALILNAGDAWTPFFLKMKPRAHIFFFSLKSLGKKCNGIFLQGGKIRFRDGKWEKAVLSAAATRKFSSSRGAHNLQNLLAAMLATHLMGVPWNAITKRIATLPQIPLREEIIAERKGLTVVNDSAATSPDGTVAALERFKDRNPILIAGGTDKNLEFGAWAGAVKRRVKPDRLFLLAGSATKKMVRALRRASYFRSSRTRVYPQLFETLHAIVKAVKQKVSADAPSVVLFSPGAASFEKFQNEFDRGRKFNLYWKQN